MKINVAHFHEQGTNCLVIDADHVQHTQSGRAELLSSLTAKARRSGLAVEKSVLAFVEYGRVTFFGTPDLSEFMAGYGLPTWTHTLDV